MVTANDDEDVTALFEGDDWTVLFDPCVNLSWRAGAVRSVYVRPSR